MTAVTAFVAARELNTTATTIRRWIREGCPAVRSHRPAMVDIDAVRAWRDRADPLALLRRVLLETYQREAANGMPAHRCLSIPDRQAAVLLLMTYDRLHVALAGTEPSRPWPPEIAQLRRFAGGMD